MDLINKLNHFSRLHIITTLGWLHNALPAALALDSSVADCHTAHSIVHHTTRLHRSYTAHHNARVPQQAPTARDSRVLVSAIIFSISALASSIAAATIRSTAASTTPTTASSVPQTSLAA